MTKLMAEENKQPNPLSIIGSLLGTLSGKSTKVAVNSDSKIINIQIDGVEQKIALKHIRNMFDEMLQSKGEQ
jgi:hypothetical protein